ncbi:MAG: GerAB/ArcD/ProY family transporter [Candidatus Pristimantibacillus sp.]
MEKISHSQLASTFMLFIIGSSSLFLLAGEVGKDAWLAVLVGMVGGLLLLVLITLPIYRKEPRAHLFELLLKNFGKPIGFVLSFAYILYFCYSSIRNVREFGDLTVMYLLPNTPLPVIVFVICALSCYVVSKGINVFFQMAEVIFPIVIGLYLLLILFIALSGLLHFNNTTPVLENGLMPILHAAIPKLISFPFGEVVLFLMFWNSSDPKGISKLTVKCYLFSGLFITLTNLFIILGMGRLATVSNMPFIQMANLIQIGNFLERIDPVVALLLFTGVFFKLTAYYFGAVLGLSYLFNLKHKTAIWPIATVLFAGSLLFRSYMQQVWVGFQYNVVFHFPLFQVLIPILLLLVLWIRQTWSKKVQIG